MPKISSQVWSWSSLQRKHDFLMNKAYIKACSRFVKNAFSINPTAVNILDIGAGSGLVLKFIKEFSSDSFQYTGTDLNSEGLEILLKRADKLNCKNQVNTIEDNITISNNSFINKYDMIISNFCLYTIKSPQQRINALKNISSYIKSHGSIHISVPTENYSAENIALQCLKDEINDNQNIVLKVLRSSLLVPYQWHYVLKPIAQKAQAGHFIKFTLSQIKFEFTQANLEIKEIALDYGGCGYQIHAIKSQNIES